MKLKRHMILDLCVLGIVGFFFYSLFSRTITRDPQLDCMVHLKQIGLGMALYAQDNDGMLPRVDRPASGATWKTDIMPYIKSREVFACPARKLSAADRNGLPISYAVNTAGVGRTDGKRGPFAPSRKPVNIDHIANASQVIAICEVQKTSSPGFDIDDPFFGPRRQVLYAAGDGLSNVVFLDGHAKRIKPLDTAHGQVDEGGKLTNMWYLDGSQALSENGKRILATTKDAFDGG